MILALDIATQTGWADSNGNHGTLDLSTYAHDYGHMFHVFEGWIADKLMDLAPDVLAIERPFTRLGGKELLLQGLNAHAHKTAYLWGCERRETPPTTIKKFATGSGRASKAEMIEAVTQWGFKPANDHEADAIALMTYWRQHESS